MSLEWTIEYIYIVIDDKKIPDKSSYSLYIS